MAVYDKEHDGYRVFIGDLGSSVAKYELEKDFERYGQLTDIWVARNPPGFAFVVYKHSDDAMAAVRGLNGRMICGRRVRVEHSRPNNSKKGARDSSRRSPRRDRSRSRDRKRSRSRDRERRRSRSRSNGRQSRRSRSRELQNIYGRRSTSRGRKESPLRLRSKSRSRSR